MFLRGLLVALTAVLPTPGLAFRDRGEGLRHRSLSDLQSWEQLAQEAGTDKVTAHGYQVMYSELLDPMRQKPINFLEIGLGCNTLTGPGKSFTLWENYFTHKNTSINYIEIDGECVALHGFQPRNGKVFIGSQSDESFLAQTAHAIHAVGGMDVIIDDGGHSDGSISTTFKHLWDTIKPGGLYIVEDLFFVHWDRMKTAGSPYTFTDRINHMINRLVCDMEHDECKLPANAESIAGVSAVHCYHRACAIRKERSDEPLRCTDCPLYWG